MAEDKAPDTIDLDSWCQEPDPLTAFAEEPPNQPHHAKRPVPTVAGVAAFALVAVGTLAALNAVRTSVAGERQSVVTSVADNRGAAILPRTTLDRLLGQLGFEPIPSPVEAPRAVEAVAPVDRPVADTGTNRSAAVTVPLPVAPNQAGVEETSRRVSPAVVAETPLRGAPIEETLARVVEAAPTPAVRSTASSGVTPATPPPTAPSSIVAALGTMPLSAAPAASLPSPPRVMAASAAIDSVLHRYESAFSALDARGAKTVWPSVNERSLERAFDSLESQEFDLGSCDISVTPPRAVARCDGSARYVPKVGTKTVRSESRRWTFLLQQSGQDWSIESVDAQ